jgi:hypothetical protein
MISFLIFVTLMLISPHDSFIARWPEPWITLPVTDGADPRDHFDGHKRINPDEPSGRDVQSIGHDFKLLFAERQP